MQHTKPMARPSRLSHFLNDDLDDPDQPDNDPSTRLRSRGGVDPFHHAAVINRLPAASAGHSDVSDAPKAAASMVPIMTTATQTRFCLPTGVRFLT
jgi:hypothetical protein